MGFFAEGMKPLVSVSILSTDLLTIKATVKALEKGGADFIHIDIMDGSFVPEISWGAGFVAALKKITYLPLDVHLMVDHPERHISRFLQAGSDILTFHLEATMYPEKLLNIVRESGKKAGIALAPSTHEGALEYLYDKVDHVLVMTVTPGYCGQLFITSQLKKIQHIAQRSRERQLSPSIGVDGGINQQTANLTAKTGANIIVSGSFVFSNGIKNIRSNINSLRL